MTILLAAGERVPVDARVVIGADRNSIALLSPARVLPQPAPVRQPPAGRNAQSHRSADHRRDGRRPGLLPRRDGADDGSGRGPAAPPTAASPTVPRGSTLPWFISRRC